MGRRTLYLELKLRIDVQQRQQDAEFLREGALLT
jgi:hypothetical protein